MGLEIVTAVSDDFESINYIVREGHEEHVEQVPHVFKSVEKVMPQAYFDELIESSTSDILIVKDDGEIIAFAVISLEQSPPFDSLLPREFAYINDFGVKSTVQRKGYGKALFTACVQWAKSRNAESLELNVWEFNAKAIQFYEHFNMQTVSRKMTLKL